MKASVEFLLEEAEKADNEALRASKMADETRALADAQDEDASNFAKIRDDLRSAAKFLQGDSV